MRDRDSRVRVRVRGERGDGWDRDSRVRVRG